MYCCLVLTTRHELSAVQPAGMQGCCKGVLAPDEGSAGPCRQHGTWHELPRHGRGAGVSRGTPSTRVPQGHMPWRTQLPRHVRGAEYGNEPQAAQGVRVCWQVTCWLASVEASMSGLQAAQISAACSAACLGRQAGPSDGSCRTLGPAGSLTRWVVLADTWLAASMDMCLP